MHYCLTIILLILLTPPYRFARNNIFRSRWREECNRFIFILIHERSAVKWINGNDLRECPYRRYVQYCSKMSKDKRVENNGWFRSTRKGSYHSLLVARITRSNLHNKKKDRHSINTTWQNKYLQTLTWHLINAKSISLNYFQSSISVIGTRFGSNINVEGDEGTANENERKIWILSAHASLLATFVYLLFPSTILGEHSSRNAFYLPMLLT